MGADPLLELERAADRARDTIVKAVLLAIFVAGTAATAFALGGHEGRVAALTPTPGKQWLCAGDMPDAWTCVPHRIEAP